MSPFTPSNFLSSLTLYITTVWTFYTLRPTTPSTISRLSQSSCQFSRVSLHTFLCLVLTHSLYISHACCFSLEHDEAQWTKCCSFQFLCCFNTTNLFLYLSTIYQMMELTFAGLQLLQECLIRTGCTAQDPARYLEVHLLHMEKKLI